MNLDKLITSPKTAATLGLGSRASVRGVMNIKVERVFKMKYFVSILLVCFLGASFTAFARPELSQAMIEIFESQSTRLQGGREGLEELLSDLDGQAKKGDPIAQFFYATMSSSEKGFDSKNKKYLQSSASKGCAGAAGILSTIFLSEDKNTQGMMWLKYAAKNGDAPSQYYLGQHFLAGKYDLKKSEVEGGSWILLAKDQSFSSGLTALIEFQMIEMAQILSSEKVISRYASLKSEIPLSPKHPCGQSIP